jgi:hypothetical protein
MYPTSRRKLVGYGAMNISDLAEVYFANVPIEIGPLSRR